MAPEYRHTDLPGRDYVRILQVLGDEPAITSVNCRILTVSLTEAQLLGSKEQHRSSGSHRVSSWNHSNTGYEALSWTWGAGDKDQSLRILDNKDDTVSHFPVRDHLYQALLALRHHDKPR